MIGSLLKQLFHGLGRFTTYHTRRILHLHEGSASPGPNMDAAISPERSAVYTATDLSIAQLNDDIGLDPKYEHLIQWNCYQSDTPPDEVASNALYKLWNKIPTGLKWTQYFDVYESVFGPARKANLRILEIGIWQGASMQLWRQYFDHPETIIVGIDVLPECKRFNLPETGVHVRIGSQADPAFLQTVVKEFGPFDLIIDDGSHHSSHIIVSFNELFLDGLKDSGIYFVEDLHANYWHPWRDSRNSFLDVCKQLLEHMHAHYRGASPVDFLIDTPSKRPTAAIEVPFITPMIKEIRFFDSMVAIYKARAQHVPYFLRSEK